MPTRTQAMSRPTRDRTVPLGFSLIELLVVIAITALLIGIALPVLGRVRDSARRAVCLSNARQVVTGVNAFGAVNQSRLPENRTLIDDRSYVTWRATLRDEGFVPGEEVWVCPAHRDPGPGSEQGMTDRGAVCASDVNASYALNGHVLWRGDKTDDDAVRPDTAILRPSHTILVAETNSGRANIRASDPLVANFGDGGLGLYSVRHDRRGVYAFQDGHAEVLGFLETGSPDCRWHNGRDLTADPYVPQRPGEVPPHAHPDWEFLVPEVYLRD